MKQRRAQTKSNGKQQGKASTGREIEKIIVFVTQNVDTSEVEPPVPEGERESHILYCDHCNFCTPDKRYFKKHNTRQCPRKKVAKVYSYTRTVTEIMSTSTVAFSIMNVLSVGKHSCCKTSWYGTREYVKLNNKLYVFSFLLKNT